MRRRRPHTSELYASRLMFRPVSLLEVNCRADRLFVPRSADVIDEARDRLDRHTTGRPRRGGRGVYGRTTSIAVETGTDLLADRRDTMRAASTTGQGIESSSIGQAIRYAAVALEIENR